jgi:hypothetical protein
LRRGERRSVAHITIVCPSLPQAVARRAVYYCFSSCCFSSVLSLWLCLKSSFDNIIKVSVPGIFWNRRVQKIGNGTKFFCKKNFGRLPVRHSDSRGKRNTKNQTKSKTKTILKKTRKIKTEQKKNRTKVKITGEASYEKAVARRRSEPPLFLLVNVLRS